MSLCLSFFHVDAEQTAARVRAAAGQAARIELRLDRAPHAELATVIEAIPVPVIATCQRVEEGGYFTGDEQEREQVLLAAAHAGARFIDLPLGATRPVGLPAVTRVVHSWHEAEDERADLRLKLHQIESVLEPGDVAKVVSWAATHEDALRVLALYGTTRAPLVAFAQGPGGRATRAWAPVFGASWTYVCAEGEPTGVGQWSLSELFSLHPPGGADADTALYGVVGRPIAHSRSPLLWNTAFRLSRLNAFYLPLELHRFDRFLHGHRAHNFQGFSVTAPFKREALEAAQVRDANAEAAGAANALWRTSEGWRAGNTDGPAALNALEAAGTQEGDTVLVLGAGGAARGAAYEALSRGYAVHLAARRAEAADSLATELAEVCGVDESRLTASGLELRQLDRFQIIVQATPVGSAANPGNLLAGRLMAPGTLVLDMVYAPAQTALLAQTGEQGGRPVAGYDMLVRQMALQFERFTGQEVPLEPLRRTVEADLGLLR